ncbi:MAG: cation-translocating P-type ATPase [Prosthecobacter sp.]
MNTPPPSVAWHAQSPESVLEYLKTSIKGLSASEVAQRLAADGPNELKETKVINLWRLFLGQFSSLIVWILIVAGFIAGLLGEWVDSIAILAIVVLNSVIGFYQEFNAEKAIAALKKMTAPSAKVWRDGHVVAIPAAEVVTGDVLEIEDGDLAAADARLLEASSLRCIESSLTGESEAVEKKVVTLDKADVPLGDRENMVFAGTSVASGTAKAVVVATGMQTEMGRIAGLLGEATLEEAGEGTPLQHKLAAFGRLLVWISLGIVGLLFVLGLLRGMKFFELFLTSVSLAVAAVPEGLPAIVTISLALGVRRMSHRRALVRKLPAVETLGSTSVICTDKTGTLTVGEMTARAFYVAGQSFEITGEGYGPDGKVLMDGKAPEAAHAASLLELGNVLVGGNNSHLQQVAGQWKVIGDPTEGALLSAGGKAGGDKERADKEQPRHHEIPFDSDRKRHTVVRLMPDKLLRAFVNGAPDKLLALCTHVLGSDGVRPITDADRNAISAENSTLAGKAMRVLGAAYRDLEPTPPESLTADQVERELVFVGLTGLVDPPRPEVKDAVSRCLAAGIRVVMITGDHPQTAMAIAHELGIATGDNLAVSGIELEKMSDDELKQRAPQIAVYARVTAAHKLRIIRAWKANDAVVAMTGDGVNDAPAIKGADIGIAMGRGGTEVTKQASDMIITDDNFATIVAAVEEGRGIYDNIRKTLQYLLAGNTGELLLMMACILSGLPMPLLPIHLLWINLVTDGLPALCLAVDPIDADVMTRAPRPRNERITSGSFLGMMFFTGVLTAGVSFAVFLYGLRTETVELARTHAFATLVFAELFRSFGVRSETKTVWQMGFVTNIRLLLVVAVSFIIQITSHHSRFIADLFRGATMDLSDCIMLTAVAAIPLVLLEIIKVFRSAASSRTRGSPSSSPCTT